MINPYKQTYSSVYTQKKRSFCLIPGNFIMHCTSHLARNMKHLRPAFRDSDLTKIKLSLEELINYKYNPLCRYDMPII